MQHDKRHAAEGGPQGPSSPRPDLRERGWRVLDTGFAAGARNMAVDEAILQAHAAGQVPPTLRFYGWDPPAVSIGYFQSLTGEVDLDACRRRGVEWVRRPTGGRAIFHHRELTYSVVIAESLLPGTVLDTYRLLSEGLLAGMQALGAPAELSEEHGAPHPGMVASSACFDAPSQYELVVGGRKVVGSAQMRRDGVILQHGSILLDLDYDLTFALLNLPEEQRARQAAHLRRRAAGVAQVLGRPVSWHEAREAIQAGFAAALGLAYQFEPLTTMEVAGIEVLYREKYSTAEWNERK